MRAKDGPAIWWIRRDLRVSDNPALAAANRHENLIPLFVWDSKGADKWAPGAASRWWIHHSLKALTASLKKRGSSLIIRRGDPLKTLRDVVKKTGARAIHATRLFDPAERELQDKICQAFEGEVECDLHGGYLLCDPESIRTTSDEPYRVFTPFWRAAEETVGDDRPLPAPSKIKPVVAKLDSIALDDLHLLPRIDWAGGLDEAWKPGERGAQNALQDLVDETVDEYGTQRDRPDRRGTSRLSPHLHFGELSPRQVWSEVSKHLSRLRIESKQKSTKGYLRQLGWREFSAYVLFHFPETTNEPMNDKFSEFPWKKDEKLLKRWQHGRTGYPIVDAGMKELWTTGWMHNRVRMITASFLTKDLMIDWREGARWFWDTLVDADLANNSMGWQWTAGCGADAAPYFRVFNPVLQSKKFDPDGEYVRRWLPALQALPERWIHEPWNAPTEVLQEAGVQLGDDYPEPTIDHADARERALAAWKDLRS